MLLQDVKFIFAIDHITRIIICKVKKVLLMRKFVTFEL